MALRGLITHPGVNPPLAPLTDTETKAIAAILEELSLRQL
jgi:dihydrodipicolinate synthase/N-acetylneuraminate lyase